MIACAPPFVLGLALIVAAVACAVGLVVGSTLRDRRWAENAARAERLRRSAR